MNAGRLYWTIITVLSGILLASSVCSKSVVTFVSTACTARHNSRRKKSWNRVDWSFQNNSIYNRLLTIDDWDHGFSDVYGLGKTVLFLQEWRFLVVQGHPRSLLLIIIIIISPTTSKPRRNMGRPIQGRGAIAVQLSLPLSVKYISRVAM